MRFVGVSGFGVLGGNLTELEIWEGKKTLYFPAQVR